ncbi:Holliday junction branch migration DNA helicase RuvB [Mycoplasmopsis columboralis]|uniref:Holliday junction branch migration complex subunit RuvB n=1 Tax=Mycoplasmopsis columboralis TaxID=171282 RepID=A0A449B6G7_9BACT|nr:Holliday junction branch migration DNA helicase RuvB [Mycoplasmopsis columboralis]VEU76108.1 Holliday junction ATP-dependent DNA helicase RuvB [Mycoplasmopsis columboralis]
MKSILRPLNFSEFIGQKKLIKTIKAMIDSSIKQNKILDHILLHGLPGLGKTTLATIIANETNKRIHYIQGANIEKKSDIISVLSLIQEGDIVFIDEIHSINKLVIEFLYNAMEDFVFDLIIGVDSNAKAIRMKIKPFTLIGATTKLNEISQPFKDRFGFIGRFVNYDLSDLIQIAKNSAKQLEMNIPENQYKTIALYSRSTPRIVNHLLSRIKDFALSLNDGIIDNKVIKKTFNYLELYPLGLSKDHIEYLQILKDGFDDKSVSLDVLCGLSTQTKENILNEIEPILLYLKLIEKNSKGRKITTKGIDYLIKEKLSLT